MLEPTLDISYLPYSELRYSELGLDNEYAGRYATDQDSNSCRSLLHAVSMVYYWLNQFCYSYVKQE